MIKQIKRKIFFLISIAKKHIMYIVVIVRMLVLSYRLWAHVAQW